MLLFKRNFISFYNQILTSQTNKLKMKRALVFILKIRGIYSNSFLITMILKVLGCKKLICKYFLEEIALKIELQ